MTEKVEDLAGQPKGQFDLIIFLAPDGDPNMKELLEAVNPLLKETGGLIVARSYPAAFMKLNELSERAASDGEEAEENV